MEITHVTGTSVNTDNLPDVDAMLMEESKKLHELFAKYNRQLFLVGEMKASENKPSHYGCSFFHIAPLGMKDKEEEFQKALNVFYWRIDNNIRGLTHNQLCIGNTPPSKA